MHPRTSRSLYLIAALFATLVLPGCAALKPAASSGGAPSAQQDAVLETLSAGMQQCLTNQDLTLEQLRQQQRQLERQQEQLKALTSEVEAAARPGIDEAIVPAAVAGACVPATDISTRLVVGQLETVWLQNLQLALPARIDTGAETASLDARNIELFERDGRRWVRFDILHPQTGEPLPVERKLKRMVAIVQSNIAESERRPVIVMGITIGDIVQTAEFTLSNRSHLDYQVLVGRNILKDFMIVDVSKENLVPLVQPGSAGETQ